MDETPIHLGSDLRAQRDLAWTLVGGLLFMLGLAVCGTVEAEKRADAACAGGES